MSTYNEAATEFKPCRTYGWCKQDCTCTFYGGKPNSSSDDDVKLCRTNGWCKQDCNCKSPAKNINSSSETDDAASEYAWQTDDLRSDHSESDEVHSVYAWEADEVRSVISSKADDTCSVYAGEADEACYDVSSEADDIRSVYAWEANENSVDVESILDEVQSVCSMETDIETNFNSSIASLYNPNPFEKLRSQFPFDSPPKGDTCKHGCCKGEECRSVYWSSLYYPAEVKDPTEGDTPFGFRINTSDIQRVNNNKRVAHGTFVKLGEEKYEYTCILCNKITISLDGDKIREVLHEGTTYCSFASLPPKVANIVCNARADLNNV